MKTAALIVILLSGHGSWMERREETITFQFPENTRATEVAWSLSFEAVNFGGGKIAVTPGKSVTVKVTPKLMGERTPLRLVYDATDAAGKRVESGEVTVQLFPWVNFQRAVIALGRKKLVVWEGDQKVLSAVLKEAKVPHAVAASAGDIAAMKPIVLIIGPDALDPAATDNLPLLDLARGGASILILPQTRVKEVAGYQLAPRRVPANLYWRFEHQLLEYITKGDLKSWVPEQSEQTMIKLLAADTIAEIGSVVPERATDKKAPRDVLIASITVGTGRIVFCQLPRRDDWTRDPCWLNFLSDALRYLPTPVDPMPGRSGDITWSD